MTENNNDRSDRAERLRRMREQRTTNSPDEQSSGDQDAAESADDANSAEAPSDSTADHDDESTAADVQDEPPATDDAADGAAADTADDAPAAEAVQSEETPSDAQSGTEPSTASESDAAEGSEGPADPEDVDSQPDPETSVDDEEAAADENEENPPDAPEDEQQHESYQVIEFELGDDRYGVDITRADEVLAYREVTRVPNTPDLIRGVVDIRGQIITVIDPTTVFNPRGQADGDGLIVVFEVDLVDGSELIGWAVDNVLSVHTVDESEIVEPPEDGTTVEAALEREDGYLTLTTPESLLAATGTFTTKISDTGDAELSASG